MRIHLHPPLALHEQGRRDGNEDSIYPHIHDLNRSAESRLFMVCDGVGGLEKGEEASRLACSTFAQFLIQKEWVGEPEIAQALSNTELAMDQYIERNPEAEGMATTLTLLALHQKGATVAHVGDSRVYQVRAGQIIFRTSDHSLVNDLVARNIITKEEAVTHPQRNVILRAISGSNRPTRASISYITDIRAGDYFFLCSDGILESVTDANLAFLLNQPGVPDEEKVAQILNLCRQNSRDNFSAYLINIRSVEEPAVQKAPIAAPTTATATATPATVPAPVVFVSKSDHVFGSFQKDKLAIKLLSGIVVAAVGLIVVLFVFDYNQKTGGTTTSVSEVVDSTIVNVDTAQTAVIDQNNTAQTAAIEQVDTSKAVITDHVVADEIDTAQTAIFETFGLGIAEQPKLERPLLIRIDTIQLKVVPEKEITIKPDVKRKKSSKRNSSKSSPKTEGESTPKPKPAEPETPKQNQ